MALKEKLTELHRLIDAFEVEAARFHNIQFHTLFITESDHPNLHRKFVQPNHAILLWQYYGKLNGTSQIDDFVANLSDSDLQWGLRGCALSLAGVIEGEATPQFVRMAIRAGCLFDRTESDLIKSRIL